MAELTSSNFEPYWLEEKDWLFVDVPFPRDDEEDLAFWTEYTGYLLAFAQLTDTRNARSPK